MGFTKSWRGSPTRRSTRDKESVDVGEIAVTGGNTYGRNPPAKVPTEPLVARPRVDQRGGGARAPVEAREYAG